MFRPLALFLCLAMPAAAQQAQPQQPDDPQGGFTLDESLPDIVAVLSFSAATTGGDPLATAAELARDPRAARVALRRDAGEAITGRLVFEDVAALEAFRADGMADYFAPVGGMDSVEVEMTAFRPALLRRSDAEALLDGLDSLSITYSNDGNRAAGDADIDAVTVICTGGDADCTPSN